MGGGGGGGKEGNGGRWEGNWGRWEGIDELGLGSHLALSCYFWGGTLSPLLDGGKSMGETLGRRENMASPGTCRKLVGVVLSEAEYIIRPPFLVHASGAVALKVAQEPSTAKYYLTHYYYFRSETFFSETLF